MKKRILSVMNHPNNSSIVIGIGKISEYMFS